MTGLQVRVYYEDPDFEREASAILKQPPSLMREESMRERLAKAWHSISTAPRKRRAEFIKKLSTQMSASNHRDYKQVITSSHLSMSRMIELDVLIWVGGE